MKSVLQARPSSVCLIYIWELELKYCERYVYSCCMFVPFELMIFRSYYVKCPFSVTVYLAFHGYITFTFKGISLTNLPYSTIHCTFSTENVGNLIKGWVVTPHWQKSCRKTRHWQLQRRRVPVFWIFSLRISCFSQIPCRKKVQSGVMNNYYS